MPNYVTDLPGTLVHRAVPGTRTLDADVLWRIPRVGGPLPSPDGRTIAVPVTTFAPGANEGHTRLWLVPADGGAPRPLSGDDITIAAAAWAPDGSSLAVTGRPVGEKDAKPQVFLVDAGGGAGAPLTDLPLGVFDLAWLPDGSGMIAAAKLIRGHDTPDATRAELARRADDPCTAHATEDRVYRFWDQWLTGDEVPHLLHLDRDGGFVRDLTPDGAGWFDFMEPRGQFDIAPDGSEVAWAGIVTTDPNEEIIKRIFTVSVAGGAVRCLTADAPASASRPRYTPDGAGIVYGRQEDRYFYADRSRLYRYDRQTTTHTPWCVDWDHDPGQWEFAGDGTLVFVAARAARTDLYALAPDESMPRRLAEGQTISGPRPTTGNAIICARHSIQAPTEIFRFAPDGDTPTRVTGFTTETLDGVGFGEVRELSVTGAGGEPVQAFLVFPPNGVDAAAPLVNVVHGGPHGASGDDFHYRWNPHMFAAPGYVVVLPNFQGSTSWGNDYASRIQGAWGDRPYDDVMAVTDAVVASGLVDEQRMAAVGASYGGYMMAWIAGHTDRFRCIINHAGVYNTMSMYASDATQGRARSIGGEPWDGLDRIDRWNPARFTEKMRTPMLVIHGEKDYRVPVTQGLECYGVLKARGVPARLLYFPDENHWVLKPHNAKRWHAEVYGWLEKWLTVDG